MECAGNKVHSKGQSFGTLHRVRTILYMRRLVPVHRSYTVRSSNGLASYLTYTTDQVQRSVMDGIMLWIGSK